MAATAEHSHTHDAHGHDHGHDHHDHHDPGFLKKYVFSTDHKMIGVQYGVSGLVFLAFGFMLMLVMRWSIAHPGEPLPAGLSWILQLFGDDFVTRSWCSSGWCRLGLRRL